LNFIIKDNQPALEYQTEVKSNKKKRILKFDKPFSFQYLISMYDIYIKNKSGLNHILDYFSSKISIKDVNINIEFGLIDAYITSITYGAVCSFLGIIISILDRQLNIQYSKIDIKPLFNDESFRLNFNCIITLKIGHIINTGIKAAYYLLIHRRELKVQLQHLNS
ncbi:MAG: DUF2953 domain-containing protein, partial [Rhizobium sp.]|nr:DUF2953 domain-containing protein [Rhizobium sp.]